MLVIDYSCGIKLSTATAFSAAINTAVKQGVLIKGGAYIEQMSSANTVLLDKTGTITEGRPRVTGMTMLTDTMDEAEVLSLAMAAEETSTHPLASAILTYGRAHGAKIPPHGEIVTEVSRGSRTEVDGKCIRVGNLKYMKENGVRADGAIPDANGAIPNYVGVGDKIVAVLYAMDNPRANVRRAINALRYDGVGDIELLTGDMAAQAQAVAEMVGVDGYQAQLLPEQKAEAVLKLQSVNSDITGWVQLDGTDINFPVLTPPADDPQYYLYRNYKKESTKYGSIFLDGMCTVDSDNQVLHGHSMQDGRMFWQVIGFGSAKTVKSCPVFRYDTEKEAAEWLYVEQSRNTAAKPEQPQSEPVSTADPVIVGTRIHTITKGSCSTICAAILTLRKTRCSFTTT